MEGAVHLAVILAGRHLVEGAAQRGRKHRALLGVHAPQVQQVGLVGQQDDGDAGAARAHGELVQLLHGVEAATVGDRVDQHYSVGPLDGAGHVLRQGDAVISQLQEREERRTDSIWASKQRRNVKEGGWGGTFCLDVNET